MDSIDMATVARAVTTGTLEQLKAWRDMCSDRIAEIMGEPTQTAGSGKLLKAFLKNGWPRGYVWDCEPIHGDNPESTIKDDGVFDFTNWELLYDGYEGDGTEPQFLDLWEAFKEWYDRREEA